MPQLLKHLRGVICLKVNLREGPAFLMITWNGNPQIIPLKVFLLLRIEEKCDPKRKKEIRRNNASSLLRGSALDALSSRFQNTVPGTPDVPTLSPPPTAGGSLFSM